MCCFAQVSRPGLGPAQLVCDFAFAGETLLFPYWLALPDIVI